MLCRYLLPESPNGLQQALMGLARNILKTPEQGAQTAIHLASAPDLQGVTSKYFIDCKVSSDINNKAFDESLRRDLWSLSEEMTDMQFSPEKDAVAA